MIVVRFFIWFFHPKHVKERIAALLLFGFFFSLSWLLTSGSLDLRSDQAWVGPVTLVFWSLLFVYFFIYSFLRDEREARERKNEENSEVEE